MLYTYLKILHILSAAFLLTSMVYSYHLWRYLRKPDESGTVAYRIQSQTWLIIIPCAIMQLATGFSMISLQDDLSPVWISSSVIGFILVMGSWFSFIYFLLLSQQLPNQLQKYPRLQAAKYKYFRRAQSIMLSVCTFGLFCLIFLMANKNELINL